METIKTIRRNGRSYSIGSGSGGGSYVVGSYTFSQTISASGNVVATIAANFGRTPRAVFATLDNTRFQIYGTGSYSASGFTVRLHNLSSSAQTQSITVNYVAFF